MKQGSLRKGARGILLRALLLVSGAAIGDAVVATSAPALVLSNTSNVTLNAVLSPNLSVLVTGGSTVNFILFNGGFANGSVPVAIRTSWNLNPGQTGAVTLYGYFTTPAQALIDGAGDNIPSAWVQGRVITGIPTTYTAFTQTNPVGPAGGSLALFSENITGANKNKTRNDNLDLRINLTGQTIPAATYTGTLRVQARAL